MGCNCGGVAGGGNNGVQNRGLSFTPPSNTDCSITKQLLTTWKQILTCVKAQGKYTEANLTQFEINQLLGVIQSALNYPDNYCYYSVQLEDFQNNRLPIIINNVTSCLN